MTRSTITHGRYTANLSPNGEGVFCVFTIDGQVAHGLNSRSYNTMAKAKTFALRAMKKASA